MVRCRNQPLACCSFWGGRGAEKERERSVLSLSTSQKPFCQMLRLEVRTAHLSETFENEERKYFLKFHWFAKEHFFLGGSGRGEAPRFRQFVLLVRATCRWNEYGAVVEWYWQGKAEVLGEKHYTAWVVDGWMSMEQWWNDTDRGKLKCWERNII